MKVEATSNLQMPMVTAADSSGATKASAGLGTYFGFLLMVAAVLVVQSRWEWSYKPQYYFGWGVPFLSLYLFLKRWGDRPEPESREGAVLVFSTFAGVLLAAWLPLRVLREANMDWRLLQWIIGGGVVMLMLAATWHAGGNGWLRHFAFPILFLLVSVTWPSDIEGPWVLFMSRFLVGLATEFLNILGWPAWSAGNIIYIPNGSVGMEDACSGIRSFQTSIMLAFFLGELARLNLPARGFLILAGVSIAFVLNLVRTLTLTFVTADAGNAAAEKWHDPLGMAILGLSFLALYGFSNLLKKRFHELPAKTSEGTFRPGILPPKLLFAMAAWLLLVEAGNELWYRRNDPSEPFAWAHLEFPKVEGLKVEPISDRVQSTLACTSAQSATWKAPDRTQWWAFVINWARGAGGNVSAYFHNPEVCLPNAGLKLVEKQHPFLFEKGNHKVDHDVYLFQQGKKPLYVFFGRRLENKVPDKMTMQDRFTRAREGKRLLASQMIEVSIAGAGSRAAAEQKYRAFLDEHLYFKPQ